jgi:hypothetical protein
VIRPLKWDFVSTRIEGFETQTPQQNLVHPQFFSMDRIVIDTERRVSEPLEGCGDDQMGGRGVQIDGRVLTPLHPPLN